MTLKTIIKYSLISAIYVVASLVMGSFSFAAIQIRIGELLMVLCLFDKKYVYPLTLGCLLTNLVGMLLGINVLPLDIIFGTLATFVSGIFVYRLKDNKTHGIPLLSLLMPAIINGIIIGLELAIYYGGANSFMILFISNGIWVFIGEIISVLILGIPLMKPLSNLVKHLDELN